MNWQSEGVRLKPDLCKLCPYAAIGKGFCPDDNGENAKIAFFLEAPGSDEIIEQKPLVGKAGKLFFSKILSTIKLTREDIFIGNTLRCNPPGNEYPTGKMREKAENCCRVYDKKEGVLLENGGIKKFSPDIFVLTYHPSSVFRQVTYLRLIQEDIKKAYNFYKKGYKPCVLMGEKAINLMFSTIKIPGSGGLKNWRGHWFFGSWNY